MSSGPQKIIFPSDFPPGKETHGLRSWKFWCVALAFLGLLSWAYKDHFDNAFAFDDAHTIERNGALDTLDIWRFMSDPKTFSTLPHNQSWRPGVTIVNSVDTVLSDMSDGVPDQKVFHIHIFISYIVLGIFLFLFILYLLRLSFPENKWVSWVALFATGFYWLHAANAETINYIISRSDGSSTLWIVITFVMYFYWKAARTYLLFLVPMILGFLFKETALMVAPLLLIFHLLFTNQSKEKKTGWIAVGAAFIVAVIVYGISTKMTPETWRPGGNDPVMYLFTQAFVIVHYFFTFLLPVNLSADTDWQYVTSAFDTRVMAGALFVGVMIYFAFRFARKPETKVASFGIAWFFIALAPTSSVIPFSEVMNDHRIFFPFIGLVLVVANGAVLLLRKYENHKLGQPVRFALVAAAVLMIGAHAYGTHKRCEVWNDGESLWKDATTKSPNNGRAWMNYGLAFMARNDVDSAIILYNRCLALNPNYVYANINMGVAQARLGNDAEAEKYYKYALLLDTVNPECYYYYGDWLIREQRVDEGIALLERGYQKSPGHSGINELLRIFREQDYVTPLQLAIETADKNPSPENLVGLSLAWYNAGEYLQCALAAEKAVEIRPDYGIAWNNICAAYNKIGEYDKAVAAGKKAVEFQAEDQRGPKSLAQSNLAEAEKQQKHFSDLAQATKTNPTYDNWIQLSLEWYNVSNFRKSKEAAEEAVKVNPNDATGWNNICAASNHLGEFDRGIEAGKKALALRPDWELAQNNLKEAERLKAASAPK
ncbi:MAG TPA: tetratricopeptide repeat protein [Bacteroidia bacterium]|nr:tetratricopeptide repeat protein [Bacteroidia bacterium]